MICLLVIEIIKKIIKKKRRIDEGIEIKTISNEATYFSEPSASLIDEILLNKTANILANEVCDPFSPNMVSFHCPVVVLLKFLKPKPKC